MTMSTRSATVRLKKTFKTREIWSLHASPLSQCRTVVTSAITSQNYRGNSSLKTENNAGPRQRPLQRLPFHMLLRNVILGQLFKSPVFFKPSLWLLERMAKSKSVFLNADRNPIIRAITLPLVYKQFCAGRNIAEVQSTIADVKTIGYSGIILNYAGEIVARTDLQDSMSGTARNSDEAAMLAKVAAWREAQIASLDAIDEGDYIGVKYTGAGDSICQALKGDTPPPAPMLDAMHAVCDHALAHNKRIWFDAEQQVYHPGIDNWTIALMRKYNQSNRAVILTTIQAYLKTARTTTERHLRLASQEGWTLGIKLVRGAYITSDIRSRIHDTKADTDASYDSIAHDLIAKSWPGFDLHQSFPNLHVFLAGHNTASIEKAAALVQRLASQDQLATSVHFGQLQGMADDVGCELLALRDEIQRRAVRDGDKRAAPRVYKCLPWGSVNECLHYLVRRAVENQGAADRLAVGLGEMKRELRIRLFGF